MPPPSARPGDPGPAPGPGAGPGARDPGLDLPVRARGALRPETLYRPRSVALLADPTLPESALLAANLAGGGFRGRLWAVGAPWPGLEPVADPGALPAAPDLAVFCLPPDRLEAAMAAMAARGAGAGLVPGPAPDLAGMIARTGLPALGQGSFGLCVPAIGLNASLSHLAPQPGRLALVCQSSALARAVLDWAAAEAVGFSHVIGVGGNAGLGFAQALDWLSRDPGTGAVLLDLRRIRNRRMFVSAARAVARTRPVVAVRPGGRLADGSGTADAVMRAALRRAGVLRVEGLEDLLSAAETLARVRRRRGVGPDSGRGDRVAIVANGAGLGALAADAVLAGGGRLARLSAPTLAALRVAMPDLLPAGPPPPGSEAPAAEDGEGWRGPLSLGPRAGTRLGEVAALLAAAPEVDAVVALHAPPADGGSAAAAAGLAAAAGATRGAPVLVGWTGQATAGPERHGLARAGIAVFATPEAAVRGALHLAQDRRNRAAADELPARDMLALAPDRAAVRRLFAAVRAAGRLVLTEDEALSVLAAYALPTVPRRVVKGAEEAAAAASMLGFPAVLKVLSPDLPRKTEVGGVVLGLRSAAEVLRAGRDLLAGVRRQRPEARLGGLLVQRQAAPGLELRLRLGEDAMFGPWIGFGLGGTAAELLDDARFDLPPLNRALARGLIARSRAARLLDGWRDRPPSDRLAVADALVRLSQIAVDFPEIATLEVNPLVADAQGVLALDASLRLRPAGERAVLAISPYPAELAGPWRARDGRALEIRPVRPEDAGAHAEAFRHLSPEDVRWRFFSALRELPPERIARLTQIDYDREMAFVATADPGDGGPPRTVGVSRLVREGESARAEFAVVVLPDWKGQGLGSALMARLFDWGRAQGVTEVTGQVLADNAPMLAFVRSVGFALARSAEDPEVVEAHLTLAPAPAAA